MKKNLKIGDKVKGFKFGNSSLLGYDPIMDEYVDVTGVVSQVYIHLGRFTITFPDGYYWTYPLYHPKSIRFSNLKRKLK